MVLSTGDTAATAKSDVKKTTKTHSPIIWHLFDTIIVVSTDKDF